MEGQDKWGRIGQVRGGKVRILGPAASEAPIEGSSFDQIITHQGDVASWSTFSPLSLEQERERRRERDEGVSGRG